MTRVPIDQAPAGPALDAAVAGAQGKRVKWMENAIGLSAWPAYFAGLMSSRDTDWISQADWRGVPEYSTDIAAAWELMEAKRAEMMAKDWIDFCDILKELILRNSGWRDVYALLSGLTPLAITRAYLKAKGVETIDIPD